MASAINFVKDVFLSFMIMLSMVFAPYGAEPYEAKNPDKATLVFNAVSDVHVETNNTASYSNFEKIIRNLKANQSSDATVFLGDNTMNGQITENLLFFGAVGSMLKSENTLIALGNHDAGNGNGNFDELLTRYTRFHNLFLKNKLDKPYYYRVINGCYMIFLSGEDTFVNDFYMSESQIEWLKNTLKDAAKTENPIFVFSHHPLSYIRGENKNVLVDILSEYENIYHLHGHTHGAYNIYTIEGITCVNLPRVTETVDYAPGTGVTVEVYEDKIIFRERDFYEGEWRSETVFQITQNNTVS